MRRIVTDEHLVDKWTRKKQNAKSRGIEFSLSLTGLRNIMMAEKCYFTGIKLCTETLSIDMIDNKLGYETGNVVACHVDFNTFKGHIENNKSLDIELAIKGLIKANKRIKLIKTKSKPCKYGYSAGDFVRRKMREGAVNNSSAIKVIRVRGGKVSLDGCSREMNASQYEKVL